MESKQEGFSLIKEKQKGPGAFKKLLHYPLETYALYFNKENISIKAMSSGENRQLCHSHATRAVEINNQVFATASTNSIKLWDANNLTLIKEYTELDNASPEHYRSKGAVQDLQVLSNKFLVTYASVGVDNYNTSSSSYSKVQVLNLETGTIMSFELNSFLVYTSKVFIEYNIRVIPDQINQFALFDTNFTNDFYILELDEENEFLKVVAAYKNSLGSFYNVLISPDGKYWTVDLRFGSDKRIYGIQIYKVDTNNHFTRIATMDKAGSPFWNGTKLLYDFHDEIYEFDPKKLIHILVADKFITGSIISPSFSNGYFNVINWNNLESFFIFREYMALMISELEALTRLPQPLIQMIGEYLISKTSDNVFSAKPSDLFNTNQPLVIKPLLETSSVIFSTSKMSSSIATPPLESKPSQYYSESSLSSPIFFQGASPTEPRPKSVCTSCSMM